MTILQRPCRGFLDWPLGTEAGRVPDGALVLCGIPLSEPYPGQAWPNDQATAPDAIRREGFQYCDGPDHWDFDLGGSLAERLTRPRHDLGNLVWSGHDYPGFLNQASQLFEGLWARGCRVFALGGDHGVSIPLLAGLKGVGEPVHIVHVDAHLDWRDEVQGVRHGYSSPLRRASEMPWISGMTQIGLRGTGSARRPEFEAAQAWGSRLLPARVVHERFEAVLEALPERGPFYLTIDADGVDPAIMPGVLAPAPGGLTAAQMFRLLRELARRGPLVGMDVVEVAPSFDAANKITAIMAGRLLLQGMAAACGTLPGEIE